MALRVYLERIHATLRRHVEGHIQGAQLHHRKTPALVLGALLALFSLKRGSYLDEKMHIRQQNHFVFHHHLKNDLKRVSNRILYFLYWQEFPWLTRANL